MRPTTLVQDEEPELSEDEDMSDVGEPEKDATEEELERLVFGDTVGFRNELKGFKQVARLGEGGDVSDDEEEEENALAAVDSADVCNEHISLRLPIRVLMRKSIYSSSF